ncbi:hypothetical protein KVR01_013420 [Diaporthe batatas]|uniref:uncharacterized protein n=1 Tax=Diaporthe batatas TaxID=748121 RepID=UPI001D039447|nr:uncharacterized protein KVR01_013420 [Diaporthe batatas]KAG8156815.1 hypothetical protein KVR01_013420 [Diaporthe batatas]
MFKRFRRSIRIGRPGSRNLEVPAPVCHECGQSVRDTISSSSADGATTGQYDSDRAGMRDSWHTSTSSDSGYGGSGSSRHSELDAQLNSSDDHPALDHPGLTMPLPLPLPLRRPTYDSSIYSETSAYDQPAEQEIIVHEPADAGPPVYDHLFDLPPRTFTNYSEKWKPKSRYSRLNELPAASPTAMAFPDDVMDVESAAEKEPSSPPAEKNLKRRSMVLRPASLKRLTSLRIKTH